MNKTILITGAGSGIGQGLALHSAADGFRVIVTDVEENAVQETANNINRSGGQAIALRVDVSGKLDIQHLLKTTKTSRVDVLINNAGLQHVAKLEDFSQEMWDQLISVMLTGTYMMTRAVLPLMRHHNFGRIINIGSIHSLVASPYKSAYVAAKHGLLGFSKVVALETADVDITINTVCPSYVKTALVDKQITAQAAEHGISEDKVINEIMLKPMPKGKFITIQELYGIVTFLISDSARNITGQVVTVDGGWTIR
ncbi:MAG: 3-hydroxybutyrate dehydrogenase [Planctomycetota bacterium]